MKIIRAKDYKDMSRKAANIISAQVIMKPNCVLGLATGGTPVGAYAQLVEWYNKGDLDFSEVTTVNLDEYRGLPKEHPESYWSFMHKNLFDKVNINPARINLPDGTNPNAEEACAKYNQIIHAVGGIDLQLLGIGHDGHIGLYHGHQDHHAGPQGADGGKRQKQGRDHQKGFLWPRYPGGARKHPADAPGLHPGGRRGSTEPDLTFCAFCIPAAARCNAVRQLFVSGGFTIGAKGGILYMIFFSGRKPWTSASCTTFWYCAMK